MALWWRCDVNNVWPGFTQEFSQITKVLLDGESLVDLARHQRLSVANSNDFASFDPPDLRGMRICDLATAYDGHLKHVVFRSDSLRSSV